MKDDSLCACGDCTSCLRRAARNAAGYVVEKRLRQRKSYQPSDPEDRAYVHRQVKLLLAMTGLGPESLVDSEDLKRSDWGKAMRARQSSQ